MQQQSWGPFVGLGPNATSEDIIGVFHKDASIYAMIGWVAALVYYGFIASSLPSGAYSIGLIYGVLSLVSGLFVASLLVAMPIQMVVMAALTKVLTGSVSGSPVAYGWGVWLCAPAGFLAARFCLDALVSFNPLGLAIAHAV
jgi:hypothetical protein